MKSYLSLIPIYAKRHQTQNRMTILCIIFSVFLVTTIFSMAEMGIRMEFNRILIKHGNIPLDKLLNSTMVQSLLLVAIILFGLILIAGVLMITSSINSSVVQRTKFFGMMRCLGMSKKQVIRFIRLESLNWCKKAIPIGVISGILVTWALCMLLRFAVGGEFATIPIFRISLLGVIFGIMEGIVAVMVAASSPAKRASKVAPITAVSGNQDVNLNVQHATNSRWFSIETSLGIKHATAVKKNWLLMSSSFALSIIIFLVFSVGLQFVGYLMPQMSNTPDLTISSQSNSINSSLINSLERMQGVKRVFGRSSLLNVDAKVENKQIHSNKIDLISFDDFDLDSLKQDGQLRWGSNIANVYGNSDDVLATWDKNSPLKIGDRVVVGNHHLKIAGLLKNDPFSSDGETHNKVTIIASKKTFSRLTHVDNYSLVSVQLKNSATNDDVKAIKRLVGHTAAFTDKRSTNTHSTYLAFVLFVYAFLVIIALIAILNVVNSISMSVSSKIKQYGAMRAVGMGEKQLLKMIAAEGFTYAVSGCVIGCTIGVFLNKLIFDRLISAHFAYAVWGVPVVQLVIICLVAILSVLLAVYAPVRRLKKLNITETINEL